MKWIGVLLNSAHDLLDGRYSPQRDDLEDFDEEFNPEEWLDSKPDPEGD